MTSRARWILVACLFLVLPAIGIMSLFALELIQGPRMKSQPNLRTYEAVMPLPPEESLPVERGRDDGEGEKEGNPVADNDENRRRGEIYYQYYCVFCHGEKGDGHGPVGDSYMPVPADLRSTKVQDYSDDRLRRAMVAGIGHEPVLERVVPLRHRGHLVVYVRALGREGR